MKIFKLLLISSLLISSTAFGQYACKDSSGNLDYPLCDANNYLDVAVMSVIPGTSATSLGKAEDAAFSDGGTGVVALGTRVAYPASQVNANGDNSSFIVDSLGSVYTRPIASTARVCATITPDTSAFAANDIIGPTGGASGLLTFANVFLTSINSGILTHVSVVNSEIDGIAFDLCIFNADPSASTVAANGAFTLAAADKQKLIGCTSVSDGRAFAAYELYQASNVNMSVDAAATSLYAILRTTGAPTWAAATVDVCLTVIQD